MSTNESLSKDLVGKSGNDELNKKKKSDKIKNANNSQNSKNITEV